MSRIEIELDVNGHRHRLWTTGNRTLMDVLHDDLGMADVRYGCGEGVCGTCTVLVDGEPVSACLLFAVQAQDCRITTLTGLVTRQEDLHPLQECFLRHGAAQCGFCTPGVILTCLALLEQERRPSRERIRYQLVGNLCRCTGYSTILDAVEDYAEQAAATPGTEVNPAW